jgi:rsbT co-antagonist protein RsbR
VGEAVLALPIIGGLDDERTDRLMRELLAAIVERGAVAVALDMTGVDHVDAATAEHIGAVCRAVALLGARVLVSGLRPEVARGIIEAGVDFSSIQTVRSLKDALRRAMRG